VNAARMYFIFQISIAGFVESRDFSVGTRMRKLNFYALFA
jgi:hypothetical protein